MLRNQNLIPLSHQHQHALALCVRIERALQAGVAGLSAFTTEIRQIFDQEIRFHFEAEEQIVFPVAEEFAELKMLVSELIAEHAVLREMFALAAREEFDRSMLKKFAELLTAHVRKEERQLFEGMQSLMKADAMSRMGAALEGALAQAQQACLMPNDSTRLRGKTE